MRLTNGSMLPAMKLDEVILQIEEIDRLMADARRRLDLLRTESDNISIPDMFEMQMLMNRLSQMSEMSTSVIAATNSAITAMARNVKS